MGILRIMNKSGDDTVTWDIERATAGDLDAQAAVKEAERIFNETVAQRGSSAFSVDVTDEQKRANRITAFDPTATQIVLVMPMVGG